jgi:glycosyltransferase involved in cell wall biosynthesis
VIYVGMALTKNYWSKAVETFASAESAFGKDNDVSMFCVTIGFRVDEYQAKMFPNIKFVYMDGLDLQARNHNFCIQHGDFLQVTKDVIEDDDVIVFIDVDIKVQRGFTKAEKEWLNGFVDKPDTIGVAMNAGRTDTLHREFQRLQARPGYNTWMAEEIFPGNHRLMKCFNTGVLVGTKSAFSDMKMYYDDNFDAVDELFGHYAKNQWLMSWVIQYHMYYELLDGSFHTHGKWSQIEGLGWKDSVATYNGEIILFNHAIPEKTMNVLAIYPPDAGTADWRAVTPWKYIKNYAPHKFNIYHCDAKNVKIDDIKGADTIFIHAYYNDELNKAINEHKKPEAIIWQDIDDNVFDVNPSNPAFKNFKEQKEFVKNTVNNADFISVTTERLKEEIMKHTEQKNIVVLPNSYDIERFEKFIFTQIHYMSKDLEECVLSWHGGSSHAEDFEIMVQVLVRIFENPNYDHVRFQAVGWGKEDARLLPYIDRIDFIDWDHPAQFGRNLMKADIGLVPLVLNNDFNECKSNIKVQEYLALGIPVVVSDSPVYHDIVTKSKGGILIPDNNIDAWVNAISDLIEDTHLRQNYGSDGRMYVRENCSMKKNVRHWLKFLGL